MLSINSWLVDLSNVIRDAVSQSCNFMRDDDHSFVLAFLNVFRLQMIFQLSNFINSQVLSLVVSPINDYHMIGPLTSRSNLQWCDFLLHCNESYANSLIQMIQYDFNVFLIFQWRFWSISVMKSCFYSHQRCRRHALACIDARTSISDRISLFRLFVIEVYIRSGVFSKNRDKISIGRLFTQWIWTLQSRIDSETEWNERVSVV